MAAGEKPEISPRHWRRNWATSPDGARSGRLLDERGAATSSAKGVVLKDHRRVQDPANLTPGTTRPTTAPPRAAILTSTRPWSSRAAARAEHEGSSSTEPTTSRFDLANSTVYVMSRGRTPRTYDNSRHGTEHCGSVPFFVGPLTGLTGRNITKNRNDSPGAKEYSTCCWRSLVRLREPAATTRPPAEAALLKVTPEARGIRRRGRPARGAHHHGRLVGLTPGRRKAHGARPSCAERTHLDLVPTSTSRPTEAKEAQRNALTLHGPGCPKRCR